MSETEKKAQAFDLMCELFKLSESETTPLDKVTIIYEEYIRSVIRDEVRGKVLHV